MLYMDETGCDEICADISDDENYYKRRESGLWLPSPEDIIRLYDEIIEKGCIELEWRCRGRRSPTPVSTHISTSIPTATEIGLLNTFANENTDEERLNKSDFDFEDDTSHQNLAVRPTSDNTPKGSAKKKTTTFDAVLSNFVRHRKQNMISDSDKNANE